MTNSRFYQGRVARASWSLHHVGTVARLYTWFATREYSLKKLAQRAFEEGFRFRLSRNKVPVTTLHKILRRRIYMGEFEYGGKIYQGIHEPLIDRATWDSVQEILDGRHAKKHRKVTHDFAFSGTVTCGHCGCSMVGEVKKKRYVYYHCTGYRGKCPEPYTREEVLERQFAEALGELIIPREVLAWLQEELVASDLTERAAGEQALRREQTELERFQTRLEVLYDDRLDGRIDASTYDKRAADIRQQQSDIRRRVAERQATGLPPASKAVDLIALTSRAAELFVEQPGKEQNKLVRLLVESASWKGGELRMCFREPFAKLRLSNSATDTKRNTLAVAKSNSGIWRRGGIRTPGRSF